MSMVVFLTLSINYIYDLLQSPILLGIGFAVFSAGVVAYRVATFNDCVDASEELKQQIREAKNDLKTKGFEFSS
ncbi:DgyrCDS4856 [Dimorphilus gyrociliatus]|uniref:Dolichol-phosphate mannosyltransferase subunit 3 n=1 Tax=Dimorphilus gyrociliatus TaxID=2664684 RepID=A0A7I8VKV4_9ANNE|nr:DgyrCDS4856 [Dimorphilus gyrociliatus]